MKANSRSFVMEVSAKDFDHLVLTESEQRPVVVNFWAPWCSPCRRLGPLLEDLVQESKGAWLLVNVNTDHETALAAAWGVRCLPVVKAFKGRLPVSEFTGSLPEPRVRCWLEALLPGGTEAMLDQAVHEEEKGSLRDAASLYRSVLSRNPTQPDALLGMARVAATQGRLTEAEDHLTSIPVEEQHRLRGPIARLRFMLRAAETGGVEASQRRVDERDDAASRYALGTALTAEGRYEEALMTFLDAIRRDRKAFGDQGRRAMLLVFDILGERTQLANHYRSMLAMELYRS